MDSAAELPDHDMVLQYRGAPAFDDTAERNRTTLVEAVEQFMAGNAEGFWSIFDPEVTFHEASCLPYGGAHVGLEATKRGFQAMADTFSEMKTAIEGIAATREIALLYQTITFRTKDSGKTGTLPVCELFRFRDGKVIEWRALYADACLMAKAISGD